MNNKSKWDQEYSRKKLITAKTNPQSDTLRFLKFLRKDCDYKLENKNILDLGCGTGRNSNYLAKENKVIAFEISKVALDIAKERAVNENVIVDYRIQDMGDPWEIESDSIDVIFDVTSSNSLNESGRENYLKESFRVLAPGGYMFVRGLCKDGDKNALNLLKSNPGKEKDTYIMPTLEITERVFSIKDFREMYEEYFKILKLDKKTNYPKVGDRIFKRNYIIAYLQK